jgi:hypothetical protein
VTPPENALVADGKRGGLISRPIQYDQEAAGTQLAGLAELGAPSNKGMKLTSVERIGRSQLITGVRLTSRGEADG